MKSASGVLICTSCLVEAKHMVQESPESLRGVVRCPKCKGKTFAVSELVMYQQDKKGNLTPYEVVLDENPQVRCLGCGMVLAGSAQHTILQRASEPVADEAKSQNV